MTTTNNPPANGSDPLPDSLPAPVQKAAKPLPREFSGRERLLVLVALLIAVLSDRLLFTSLMEGALHLPFFSGIFWLVFLAVFYAFFWERLRHSVILWVVAGFTAALCIWNLLFDYRSAYGGVTMLVIPAVIMAHCVFFGGSCQVKDVFAIESPGSPAGF